MKTSALNLVVLLTLFASTLMAQSNSFFIGANGGANLSKFKYTEDLSELYPTTNAIFGLNGGVSLGFEIQNFTFSTGLQYIQKGSEYQTNNFTDDKGTGFFSAKEKLHYISIPILVGYRKYFGDKIGLSFTLGPSINFGLAGNIDETTEYFGSDQVEMENFKVAYGSGVNDDYRATQIGFQVSPGIVYNINDRSKFTFNITWDFGTGDSFNPRYKNANDFFTDFKGNEINRSTLFTVGYERHFSFGDKY